MASLTASEVRDGRSSVTVLVGRGGGPGTPPPTPAPRGAMVYERLDGRRNAAGAVFGCLPGDRPRKCAQSRVTVMKFDTLGSARRLVRKSLLVD